MDLIAKIAMGFDYWLNRYQTLIVGVAAVLAAIWAVRPAWRQVTLLEAQQAEQRRERLAATFRMLNQAIKLLDPQDWRDNVRYADRPEDAASLDLTGDLLPAYEARKKRWSDIKDGLDKALGGTPEASLIEDEVAAVDARFAHCDQVLYHDADPVQMQHPTARWYYAAEYPDMVIWTCFPSAREKLSDRAAGTVEELAK